SWNNGAEGETDDAAITDARFGDRWALLATLFASRGTIMLTAGDEFGRTQQGNNNAYAQDNAITWLDWARRDEALERYASALSAMRRAFPALSDTHFLTGKPSDASAIPDVEWLTETGAPLGEAEWNDPARHRLVMMLGDSGSGRLAVMVNGDRRQCVFTLPAREGFHWHPAIETQAVDLARPVPGRSVNFMTEHRTEKWEPVFGQSDAKSNDHSRRASKARAGKGS
ncbi:MAG: glycogen debranching enzyme GlgX, partial [Mesorhizobium sp.]